MIVTTAELLRTMSRKRIRSAVRRGTLYRVTSGIYSDEPPDDPLILAAMQDHYRLAYTGSTAIGLYRGQGVRWPAEARYAGQGRRTGQVTLRSRLPGRLRHGNGLTLVSPVQAAMDADVSEAARRDFLTTAYQGIGAAADLEADLSALVTAEKRARTLLAHLPAGAASQLEVTAFGIVHDALIDLPVTVLVNQIIGNYRYDLAIPEVRVAVEIDSFMYHAAAGPASTVSSFVKERWKDNEATHLGWVLQHYTDYCIREAGGHVARDVRRAVESRISRQGVALPDGDGSAVWLWHPTLTRGRSAG